MRPPSGDSWGDMCATALHGGSSVGADDPYPFCPFGTLSRPLLAFGHFPPPGGIGPLTGGIGPIGPLYPSLNQNWKRGFRLRATYFARDGSSVQTAYPSSRPYGQASVIPLYLLSNPNPHTLGFGLG